MALLNPEHLFEQADQLIARSGQRAPRQANMRRAVSATYYALFHAIVTEVADQLVGIGQRDTAQYALVYRSIEHRDLGELCRNIVRETLRDTYKPFEPQGGFGSDILAVAKAFIDLQQKRHSADYDPLYRVTASDAALTAKGAPTTLRTFGGLLQARPPH